MLEKSDLLILDEPTNHLDAPSREVLEQALVQYDGTVLCVSHDRYFVKKLADRIFEMRTDGTFDFKGDYETFCEYKNKKSSDQSRAGDENKSVSDNQSDYEKNKELRNKKKNAARKLEQTEKEIADTEKAIEDNLALQQEHASDYEKVAELFEQAQTLTDKLEKLYEAWEELQQLVEE